MRKLRDLLNQQSLTAGNELDRTNRGAELAWPRSQSDTVSKTGVQVFSFKLQKSGLPSASSKPHVTVTLLPSR